MQEEKSAPLSWNLELTPSIMADGEDDQPCLLPHSPATSPKGKDAMIIQVEEEQEIDPSTMADSKNESSGCPSFPSTSSSEGEDTTIMTDGESESSLSSFSGEEEIMPEEEEIMPVVVEEEEDDLVKFFDCELRKQARSPTYSSAELVAFPIPRVPERLRRVKDYAYEPDIISIGPYHRKNPRLLAMENKKLKHLEDILNENQDLPSKELVEMLRPLEDPVRRCYTGEYTMMDRKEFLKMMLIDSCFIIHLLLLAKKDDRIWIGPLMFYDLLLLENQLPFFLVNRVFQVIHRRKYPSSSLVELVYESYCVLTRKDQISKDKNMFPRPEKVHHLLHLYHCFNTYPLRKKPELNREPSSVARHHNMYRSTNTGGREEGLLLLPKEKRTIKVEDEESGIMIPNATVLHEVGIKFKRKKDAGSVLDVKFKFKDGIIEIPPLCIFDGAVSLFRNLIAFEQCYGYYFGDCPQFAAYFKFMDHMINTVSDVTLLQKAGIIEHSYGCEKEIMHLFNKLTRGATINTNSYLIGLYRDVNNYCRKKRKKRHVWWATFIRRHCSTPLAVLSLIGALILLALTFIQAFFSVYSYYRPSSKPPL